MVCSCVFCCVQGNLSARRRALVMMAYDVLDKDGSGVVTRSDIVAAYDPSRHPEVVAGKKTPDEVITEFMAQWETDRADGTVTRDEFLDYYKGAAVFALFNAAFRKLLSKLTGHVDRWTCELITLKSCVLLSVPLSLRRCFRQCGHGRLFRAHDPQRVAHHRR
jgi:hypothetical protein